LQGKERSGSNNPKKMATIITCWKEKRASSKRNKEDKEN
jgi:hypothetical protein